MHILLKILIVETQPRFNKKCRTQLNLVHQFEKRKRIKKIKNASDWWVEYSSIDTYNYIFFLHLLTNKYITFQQNNNNNNNPNKRQVKRKSQKYKETKMEPLQT